MAGERVERSQSRYPPRIFVRRCSTEMAASSCTEASLLDSRSQFRSAGHRRRSKTSISIEPRSGWPLRSMRESDPARIGKDAGRLPRPLDLTFLIPRRCKLVRGVRDLRVRERQNPHGACLSVRWDSTHTQQVEQSTYERAVGHFLDTNAIARPTPAIQVNCFEHKSLYSSRRELHRQPGSSSLAEGYQSRRPPTRASAWEKNSISKSGSRSNNDPCPSSLCGSFPRNCVRLILAHAIFRVPSV